MAKKSNSTETPTEHIVLSLGHPITYPKVTGFDEAGKAVLSETETVDYFPIKFKSYGPNKATRGVKVVNGN
ncbi:hypothetical protein, partial [Staphylococcus aureus]|uniref:hypothetical protein n=1 Tax=Staphylococcus aureus TaxID=1280 RepID=UPI003A7FE4D1